MNSELSSELQALADKYHVQFTGKVVTLQPVIEEVDVKPTLPSPV